MNIPLLLFYPQVNTKPSFLKFTSNISIDTPWHGFTSKMTCNMRSIPVFLTSVHLFLSPGSNPAKHGTYENASHCPIDVQQKRVPKMQLTFRSTQAVEYKVTIQIHPCMARHFTLSLLHVTLIDLRQNTFQRDRPIYLFIAQKAHSTTMELDKAQITVICM